MDAIIWSGGTTSKLDVVYRFLGAYKIAHAARKAGYSVQVIDHIAHLDYETLYAATKKFIQQDTSIIGISMTWLLGEKPERWPCGRQSLMPWHIYRCIIQLKKEHPSIRWVVGGYNSSILGTDLPVNEIIEGYGEALFVELLEHAKGLGDQPESESRSSTVDPSVSRVVYTKPRRFKHDICLDDHLYAREDCIQPGETLPIEISRGCMFKCRFCHHLLLGRKKLDYLRSFELVKNQMLHNHSMWGTTRYYAICDTFNDTTTKIKMWHDMVGSLPFNIGLHAYLRTDLLHRYPDTPYQLLESGLEGSYHGIESLNEEASRVAGKAWSGRHARDYVPYLFNDIWKGKVRSSLSFIAGLPGDTRETLLDAAMWLKSFEPYHARFQPLRIFARAGYWNQSEFDINHASYGYTFDEYDDLNWKLPYWYRFEAVNFVNSVLEKEISSFRSMFSSWQAYCLLGMGHDPCVVDKSWQREMRAVNPVLLHTTLARQKDRYLQGYLSDLMAL